MGKSEKKKQQATSMEAINVRLSPDLLERAAELTGHMSEQTGRVCTRSDVLREAVVRGLRLMQHERAAASRRDDNR